MNIPMIGDWFIPDEGLPGMAVAVLPSGKKTVVARISPKTNSVVETVHDTASLKGPMRARAALKEPS